MKLKIAMPHILAILSFVGLFVIILVLCFVDVPDDTARVLAIILGGLFGIVKDVFNAYFGFKNKQENEKNAP